MHEPANIERQVRVFYPHIPGGSYTNARFRHLVLWVKLKSSEVFIIDLTGSQYGWKEIVSPFATFQARRVKPNTHLQVYSIPDETCVERKFEERLTFQWARQRFTEYGRMSLLLVTAAWAVKQSRNSNKPRVDNEASSDALRRCLGDMIKSSSLNDIEDMVTEVLLGVRDRMETYGKSFRIIPRHESTQADGDDKDHAT